MCELPWICATVATVPSSGGVGLQSCCPAAELRGLGEPTAKSTELLSVSVHVEVRATDVGLEVAAAGLPSAVDALPHPSRSTTLPDGSTIATRPPDALIGMVPTTSGVGRGVADVFAPDASLTRKLVAGATVPLSGVRWAVVPFADQYWTLQPFKSTGVPLRLYNSTKSLLWTAPELPPPPYTSEMTTDEETA